jgi:hypothetical protein
MSHKPCSYKELKTFMKGLRIRFLHNFPVDYTIGSLYSNDTTITYFPFTHNTLKEQQLKIAIVFNHPKEQFEIWLAGKNRQIQKRYWEIFKGSDWNKYHIPSTMDEGFSIVDSILVENPNFEDAETLKEQIESETMKFTEEILKILK